MIRFRYITFQVVLFAFFISCLFDFSLFRSFDYFSSLVDMMAAETSAKGGVQRVRQNGTHMINRNAAKMANAFARRADVR